MQDYDILLFIEIIETEGCRCVYEDNVQGEHIKWFIGVNGQKKVPILLTDETMTATTSKDILRQLGLEDLIERMF